MGIFKGQRYRKCQLGDYGHSVECISYKPDKTGKKIVTSTIKAILTEDCSVAVIDSDGDPSDLEDLEEHLSKRVRTKCKQPSNL